MSLTVNIVSPTPGRLLLLSRFSRVQLLCDPIDGSPPGSAIPGASPGKNTGVGCHVLLQCMKVKSEREGTQSCPTLSDPMDCSLPGSSIHGIFQAGVLEWGAIAFSSRQALMVKEDGQRQMQEPWTRAVQGSSQTPVGPKLLLKS